MEPLDQIERFLEIADFVRLTIRDGTRQRVGGPRGVLDKLAHAAEAVVEVGPPQQSLAPLSLVDIDPGES